MLGKARRPDDPAVGTVLTRVWHGTTIEVKVEKLRDELTAIEAQVIEEADLRAALASFAPVWGQLFPAERARIMQLLLQFVTYNTAAGEVSITFRPGGVRTLAAESEKGASA